MPDIERPDPGPPFTGKELQSQAITTLRVYAARQIAAVVHKHLYHRTVKKGVSRWDRSSSLLAARNGIGAGADHPPTPAAVRLRSLFCKSRDVSSSRICPKGCSVNPPNLSNCSIFFTAFGVIRIGTKKAMIGFFYVARNLLYALLAPDKRCKDTNPSNDSADDKRVVETAGKCLLQCTYLCGRQVMT